MNTDMPLTSLRLHQGENWDVFPDTRPGDETAGEDTSLAFFTRFGLFRTGQMLPFARLRRIGWIDQHGHVVTTIPAGADHNGGSWTPMLIDPGERHGL